MKYIQIKKFCLVILSLLNTIVVADTLEIGIIFPDNELKYQEAIQMAISEHNLTNHKIKIALPIWRTVSNCNEIYEKIGVFSDLRIRVVMAIGIELTDECLSKIKNTVDEKNFFFLIPVFDVANLKLYLSYIEINFFIPAMTYDLSLVENTILEYKKQYDKDADIITLQSYEATKVLIDIAKNSEDLLPENLRKEFDFTLATRELFRKENKHIKKQVKEIFCGVEKNVLEIRTIVASVRREPNKEAEIVGVLNRADKVVKEQQKGNWVLIKSQSNPPIIGWVHNMLVNY